MRSLIIALAGALLLAVVVTEFYQRLFNGSYFALLVTMAVVLFLNGLFNQRMVRRDAEVAGATRHNDRRRQGGKSGGGKSDSRSQPKRGANDRNSGGRGNRDSGKQSGQGGAKGPRSAHTKGTDSGNRSAPKPADTAAAKTPAAVPDGPREQGQVKWFNRSKGFGFIIRDNGEEIFVHQRSIRSANEDGRGRPALRDGEAVDYVVTEHEKGLQADDVVPTSRA